MPSVGVNNFTTDWNDGTMIAQLVDAHAPGLCPEYATMDPSQPLENAQYAMGLAEEWLGVPQVCIMLYVLYIVVVSLLFSILLCLLLFLSPPVGSTQSNQSLCLFFKFVTDSGVLTALLLGYCQLKFRRDFSHFNSIHYIDDFVY